MTRSLPLLVMLAALSLQATNSNAAGAAVANSVVKVFSTMRFPDLVKPWAKQAPVEASGSGVVIEGHRILTNAHVVLYATQVQVQANEAGDKVSATVVAIAPGIDLAVLKLDDESFFDSHPPLARASKLPQIKDAVLAYGFPAGGTSLSITKGIVSRIEFTPYNFPVSGLRIQVDAAINPGNSGGPAVADDKMIGLAFSKLGGGAENIGYIIPNEEIELFLGNITDGHYHGKPTMFDDLQTLENAALRDYLKLGKSVEGMVVHKPFRSEDDYPLKKWDVITHIGDTPIDNQGMVKLGPDLRVSFHYLLQKVARDGIVPIGIVRGGKKLSVRLPVPTTRPTLVSDLEGGYPSYFVYGPLVFSRATWQFFPFIDKSGGARSLNLIGSPLITRALDTPNTDLEELVVVSSPFFPNKLAIGYSNPMGHVVSQINGTKVQSLRQLVALLRDVKEDFVKIEFDQEGGESLVFPRAQMAAVTEEILNDNGVRAQGSADTLAVWQASQGSKSP